jgi:hypothetical protein
VNRPTGIRWGDADEAERVLVEAAERARAEA